MSHTFRVRWEDDGSDMVSMREESSKNNDYAGISLAAALSVTARPMKILAEAIMDVDEEPLPAEKPYHDALVEAAEAYVGFLDRPDAVFSNLMSILGANKAQPPKDKGE